MRITKNNNIVEKLFSIFKNLEKKIYTYILII